MHETTMSSGPLPSAELTACEQKAGAVVEVTPARESDSRPGATIPASSGVIDWVPLIILTGLLIFLYRHIAVKLVADWRDLPDFSHGFLIPFFAAFLLWDKRKKLRSLPVK